MAIFIAFGWFRAAVAATLALAVMCVAVAPASAAQQADAFARTLGTAERTAFENWYQAQVFFDAAMDAYWAEVEQKRRGRRAKRRQQRAFTNKDYVNELPPNYSGPQISASLLKNWRAWRERDTPKGAVPEREELPSIADYLASAKRHFNFAPERIPEIEFKKRYAREALSLGLTKDQVIRVYALETGGRGTADMQAGIHPITGKGKPISSALGYAQLLAANSINVLSKHGIGFQRRLAEMESRERDPQRKAQLHHKLAVLRRMVATAKSVPYKWSRHVAFSRTDRGRALHVLNMDGDIGPWMQVVKLADLKRTAERSGRPELSGAEIELMNLAGPGTGLEMMTPLGLAKPTPNFFSRPAYYRNTVVRGKDSRGLLEALEARMEASMKNPGAQEFIAVFDELLGGRRTNAPTLPVRAFGFMPAPFQSQN